MKSLNETTAVIYAPEILSNFPTKKTNANGTGYTTVYAPVESDRFLNDTTAVTYAPEILSNFSTKKTFWNLDIYVRIIIGYKIVNMGVTQNFLTIFSCTFNYNSIIY